MVERLSDTFRNNNNVAIAYLYCNFRRRHEQKLDDLLLSLLKQLAESQPSLPDTVKDLYQRTGRQKRPSLEDISQTVHSVTALFSRVFILVDALDECQVDNDCRTRLLSEIFSLQAKYQLNFFATSRNVPEVIERFGGSLLLEIRARDVDVERYLDGHISELPGYVLKNTELRDEIKNEIIKSVHGM